MQRFDAAGAGLVPGQAVQVQVTGHEPWGVMALISGHEGIGASIDAAMIDSPSGSSRALPHEYPGVGSEVNAVVQEVSRYSPPVWVRLTMRSEDLACFQRRCDFCGTLTVLSPGGDGVVMDVRSADGPGSTAIVSHRECLATQLHPHSLEPSRVRSVGRKR
ncbi:hypothetical protein HS041_07685 [Planomonospora sp. ID67723]|uniref:hypothetical protein n=1 Tax=Planomonospora sp. ID67723 TaxID=2738134 RepID=UPI0018C3E917|nr:hypothetical protein [Planomonospora sp. ID67723]MBG0827643.1 hypothetical protein [Planomonospora sp. ID67723]